MEEESVQAEEPAGVLLAVRRRAERVVGSAAFDVLGARSDCLPLYGGNVPNQG